MSRRRAPSALRMPISAVRSVTLTNMIFMTPMPPTIKPTDEIAMAMMPIIPKMLSNCVMKAFAVFTSKLFASENLTCRRVRKISST